MPGKTLRKSYFIELPPVNNDKIYQKNTNPIKVVDRNSNLGHTELMQRVIIASLFLTILSLLDVSPYSQTYAVVDHKKSQEYIADSRTLPPTATPTPKAIPPTPTIATPTQAVTYSGLSSEESYIIDRINEFRKSNGQGDVSPSSETCSFATTRVGEVKSSFNHDGFRSRIEGKNLPYGGYSHVTENLAMTEDYKEVITMWINSSGHRENMLKDTPFVCVKKDGSYYVYEGHKP